MWSTQYIWYQAPFYVQLMHNCKKQSAHFNTLHSILCMCSLLWCMVIYVLCNFCVMKKISVLPKMYIYLRWNKGEGFICEDRYNGVFFLSYSKMHISHFLGLTWWNLHWIDIACIVQYLTWSCHNLKCHRENVLLKRGI